MSDSTSPDPGGAHGRLERGIDTTSRSSLPQGRFGRMFRSLPPADFDDDALVKLAREMTAPRETTLTPESAPDDEENFDLPAGYTYFGQFIDHDITFDPLSSLVKLNDPDGLTNFRTPALDLDGLYGRGPDDQPYMYASDGRKFLLGDRYLKGAVVHPGSIVPLTWDLPRFHERAIIGDKRNDENVIVSQLHGLFLRFHNYVADRPFDVHGHVVTSQLSFTEIQQIVRWHYQWLVLFDFLPRIVGRVVVEDILPHLTHSNGTIYSHPPKLHFFRYQQNPFMPVEFSGAAYRFGHTMVRPVYRLSGADLVSSISLPGQDGRRLVFAPNPADGLNGFHRFPDVNGIDWRLFFDSPGRHPAPTPGGRDRVQPAYKIDTSLVNPLGFLPEFSRPGTNTPKGAALTNNLAYRNLKRGVSLQLPSGQAVARLMGLTPIPDANLRVGKATVEGLGSNKSIVQIDRRFANKAPLWFYILAEALHQWRQEVEGLPTSELKNAHGTMLGPVGGRIVGEVLIGLILGDSDSFLRTEPNWRPIFGNSGAASVFSRFRVDDLIRILPPVS